MNPTATVVKADGTTELSLPLHDLAHLFNAPGVDPLSPCPPEGLGISGFDYLLSLLQFDKKRMRTCTLTVSLPQELAAHASAEQIAHALRRHAAWRIERERSEMRNTYLYGWKVAGFAILMLAVCLALASLFASTATQWMHPLIRKTFQYGFEIMGWVILWHPIEALIFSPVAIRARLSALQTLAAMDVVIHAEPSLGTMTREANP